MGDHHFDSISATYDDPEKQARAQEIADAIRTRAGLTGRERLLEYGAGTGLVSQTLAELVGTVTLADTSSGMREVARSKVASGDLPASTTIWDLDLTEQAPPQETFDLIVTSLVLHHIQDLGPVLAGFRSMLAPGGQLAVADLDSEDGSFHAHLHDFDGHDGFDRDGLAAQLEQAGFADIRVGDCSTVVKNGTTFPVFLALARR